MTKDHYKNELIKELRESAGLTQEQLAERLKTHWGTISRIENGKSCSFSLLCQLADLFQVKWQTLLRIEDTAEENISVAA
jgi:transcriptional regulator with XRE-family HTH domain